MSKNQQPMPAAADQQEAMRVQRILDGLARLYPDAQCELSHSNPFELLVATVLSAQSTDVRVNQVTEKLFKKYATPEAFAALTPDILAEEIKELGLYRNKAKHLVALAQQLIEKHGGEVPDDRESLEALPGVGRKTANVVLSTAFGVPAIAVDTHVFRVARRLGLASAETPLAVEKELMAAIPKELWTKSHHRLIRHGRRICAARRPRCEICPLFADCRYAQQENTVDAIRAH